MRREGPEVDSQMRWDPFDALVKPLTASFEALVRYGPDSGVIGADETWWRLMEHLQAKK